MLKYPAIWISSAFLIAVCSCAPKAIVVVEENAPAVAEQETKEEEPAAEAEPTLAGPPDDGIRLPDMLTLPGENEFRKSASSGTSNGGSGAVIARPPGE